VDVPSKGICDIVYDVLEGCLVRAMFGRKKSVQYCTRRVETGCVEEVIV
jgi:hypothetical protein